MNNGVYALPGFMAPAAKNWKSQLLTNEDGSVKLCVYVGKPGTRVYYSLGIPGWKWGFIKDAQYFIDNGYPQEVIEEVSKFADYLEEEVTTLPEGTVIPDIIINGWPLPITESPIEGKVYWILNIPKFVLPAGDTEVQISANGKLLKYTITRPDFSIHYNGPGYTISTSTPGGGSGGSSTGGLTENDRELLMGAAQRDADNTFTASNTFTGSVDLSAAQVTPPSWWNVEGLTAEQVQAVVPISWGTYTTPPNASGQNCVAIGQGSSAKVAGFAAGVNAAASEGAIAIGSGSASAMTHSTAIGYNASSHAWGALALGYSSRAYGEGSVAVGWNAASSEVYSAAIGYGAKAKKTTSLALGTAFSETVDGSTVQRTCTTEGTGSITIGAGANTLNNGDTESSNSVTIGCKASNRGADSVVIGAQASNPQAASVVIGAGASGDASKQIAIGANAKTGGWSSLAIGANSTSIHNSVVIGESASAGEVSQVSIGVAASGGAGVSIGRDAKNGLGGTAIGYGATASTCGTAIGYGAKSANTGAVVFASRSSYYDEQATITQLYFAGAGTPLANTYENGEAMMGYVVRDSAGNVMVDAEGNAMVGTQKLSVLFPNNRGENAFTPAMLNLDEEWTPAPMFRPSDIDMSQEEPAEQEEYTPLPVYPVVEPETQEPEPEEYTPLPVYPIVEPEIEEEIN